ncbi:putative ATP binding related protein [Methanococcus maripaludis C5]|uniref:Putative ATP binding related protein n=1 Tax=Methanococcus maripaludis (strain C5 / ATCC BAA-1333) TaxID=402880 RepID=A4FYD5_METM5|nr:phosphoadenosine phosphosulfate reductase family protein [Methanococcus maripaludis]ABO35219.1 putative ATP binding related protein [Methanococcus maripaludis C5]
MEKIKGKNTVNCEICLHNSKTRPMYKHEGKNICIECLNALKFPRNFEEMKNEVMEYLDELRIRNNKYNCILGFSGGKDSVVALYLLVKELRIRPLCVTVDNGYLAEEALTNCKNIAKYFGVDWLVINKDFTKFFKETISKGESPCRVCSDMNMHEIWQFARQTNIDTIVTGHELPFGTTAIREMKKGINMLRLLVAYKLTEEDRYNILKEIPWEKPDLGGYTTNCLVLAPALVEFKKKHGFNFEYDRVSAMIRYGLMTREEAEEALKCPEVSDEIYEELKKRGLDFKNLKE